MSSIRAQFAEAFCANQVCGPFGVVAAVVAAAGFAAAVSGLARP